MASPFKRIEQVRPAGPKSRNVLVVDDSAVARLVIQRVINESDNFQVAAHAGSAEEALEKLRTVSVDLVILDIEMPGMDGIEAIPHIMRESEDAPILIVSSHCRENAEPSLRAMAMGASDLVLKPDSRETSAQFDVALLEKMSRLTGFGVRRDKPSEIPVSQFLSSPAQAQRPIGCLAIGASTGGIHALTTFFTELPADLNVPIFVTQHLPPDFIDHFARQLGSATGRKTLAARDGQFVKNDETLIAPGDAHLSLNRHNGQVRIVLDRRRMDHGFCPSVDPMLAAAAEIYGNGAVGVVLTGMGRDGASGAKTLADAGGELLVQDPGSSIIWGMPGAVAQQGIANLIAPPAELAASIAKRARMFGCR